MGSLYNTYLQVDAEDETENTESEIIQQVSNDS